MGRGEGWGEAGLPMASAVRECLCVFEGGSSCSRSVCSRRERVSSWRVEVAVVCREEGADGGQGRSYRKFWASCHYSKLLLPRRRRGAVCWPGSSEGGEWDWEMAEER